MKSRIFLTTIAVLALAAAGLVAGPVTRSLIPQDTGGLPFYTAGLGHTGTNADDWVVTAFYYPPADIPADYSLWDQPVYAPPVLVDTPFVQGFIVWKTGAPIPMQEVLQNAPGVRIPIWFTPAQKFANGVDGYPGMTWTINSMMAEGSLIGYADSFRETVEGQPNTISYHDGVVASGKLADGTPFWVESNVTQAWDFGHYRTFICHIHFGR